MDNTNKTGQPDIVERTVAFSLRIIKLYRELNKDSVGRILGRQLLRSGTSIGANVHEAQAAQSRPEFVSKMYIAFKEARETSYWLRLIGEAQVIRATRLGGLADETHQLTKILAAILLSAKKASRR